MPTVAPQTNITLPQGHESSPLRSPRDSDDVSRQWKRANRAKIQSHSDMQAIAALTRKVEGMRRRILGGAPNGNNVVYIKACLADGNVCYVPVVTDGIIYALNTGTVQTPTINTGSVPNGSQVLE